ncbi:hypothetical protein EDD21DRAFT_360978 [Dissophora ornata]|nr:hypothetical protein EDD21DRAFT_360978 [Dissophora ornata]
MREEVCPPYDLIYSWIHFSLGRAGIHIASVKGQRRGYMRGQRLCRALVSPLLRPLCGQVSMPWSAVALLAWICCSRLLRGYMRGQRLRHALVCPLLRPLRCLGFSLTVGGAAIDAVVLSGVTALVIRSLRSAAVVFIAG